MPMLYRPLLHQVFRPIAVDCVGAHILVLLLILFIKPHSVDKLIRILLRTLELIANTPPLRIKNIELISLDGPYKIISRNHALLVHQVIPIYLPHLQLHFAVVGYKMLPNLLLISFVPASDGANPIFQELRLKVPLQVYIGWLRTIQQVLMDILHVSESFGHWLVANFTIHYLLVRKISFENPEISPLVSINGPLFFDFEPVVILDHLNQVEVSFRHQVLEKYRKLLVLI